MIHTYIDKGTSEDLIMRNQPIPARKGNVSHTGIRRCCAGYNVPVGSRQGVKATPDLPKRRGCPGDPCASGLPEQRAHRPCPGTGGGKLNPREECCTEGSVLAQPIFVFKKKDRPLKRPAEDPVCKAENGSLSQSQLWNVIRPAILQPPQALTCLEIPVVSPETKKEVHVQVSEDSCYSAAENSVNSKTAERLSTTMNPSSSKTTQIQSLEDRSVQNSTNSDFVFGENMVERVLVRSVNAGSLFIKSPEKHPKSCNEADSYKGEITSMYMESFHVSPQRKTALLRNATLIESAAASISKPVEKFLLDKVEVITGEEAEHNVLQINCKLFVFNKLSLTWIERGRGSLRLNDTSSNKCGMLQSRLIMRNQGSLRLILNTRLWDQMVIKRANIKSLCFTATDQEDHSVQVFLIQASSKDTGYLYAAIHHRLVALRSFAEQEPDANQVDTETEIAFQPLNCDSDDEDDGELCQVSSSGSDHSRWNRRQSVVCS
ncbi:ran-binding protein 3-like isoform X5 [Larus michahellis]|uniref:ran-binding protein 3-like isoform X5 n=1 Tax=Larus michahellis TaxID=119627 RepID=UPI003D9ACCA1